MMAKLLKQKFYKKEELLLDLKTIIDKRISAGIPYSEAYIDWKYFDNWSLKDKVKL